MEIVFLSVLSAKKIKVDFQFSTCKTILFYNEKMLRQLQAILLSFTVHGLIVSAIFFFYQYETMPPKKEERSRISLSQYRAPVCITKPIVEPPVKKKIDTIVPTSTPPKVKKLPEKISPIELKRKDPIVKTVEKKVLPKKQIMTAVPLIKEKLKEPIAKIEPIPEPPKIEINNKPEEVPVVNDVPIEKLVLSIVEEHIITEVEEKAIIPILVSVQSPEQSYMEEHLALIVSLLQKNIYYPRIARRRGITGEVLISFELTKDGEVKNATVLAGKYAVLNRAAITTLERLYGKFPHPSEHLSLQVPIQFRLHR